MGSPHTPPGLRSIPFLATLVPLVFLWACGGGGGGGSTSNLPVPPPPVENAVQVGPSGSMTFSPTQLTIDAGQRVTWQWGSAGHSVDSGTDCATDNLFNSGLLGAGASFSHTFSTPGTYPYFCAPHCGTGMTGTIVVNAPSTTVLVGAGGAMSFSPALLTIRAGQTVTWRWEASAYGESGSHSLDSGTNCVTDNRFNSGLLGGGATFSHKFSSPGIYPYYCSLHCGMGMTGTIIVKP